MVRGSYVGIHSAGFRDFLLKGGLTQAANGNGNGNKKRRRGQELKPIITTEARISGAAERR